MAYAAGEYSNPHAQNPPQEIGQYKVESVLGRGGMATVYRARGRDSREVALKVLSGQIANRPKMREMFQREFRTVAKLNHPNIVSVFDMGETSGQLYIAMQLIDGQLLKDFLQKQKKLSEVLAIELARQLADILHYVHAQNIVHRDIKPENILLDQRRRAILFDFGTALDQAYPLPDSDRGVYGTPGFLSPEQILSGNSVDGRADLYSLGVMLYLMACGRRPFYGDRDDVLGAHINEPPPPPSKFAKLSPDLELVILKSIEKNPDDRYQTGAEFAQALGEIEPPPPQPIRRRAMRWLGIDSE